MSSKLEELGHHEFFATALSPMALLDADGVFRAVNAAYLDATGSTRSELLSRQIFEAFPDNPQTPEARSVERLRASLERVLRARRPDHMGFQRYDVPNRATPGEFVTKTWMPVNSPVRDDGAMIGVLHRVDDVTRLSRPRAERRADAGGTSTGDSTAGNEIVAPRSELEVVLAEAAQLARENRQLQAALESRSHIDAAKGMVMLELGCDADTAFAFLSRISQVTNVRVADVATAMAHHASQGRDAVRQVLELAQATADPPDADI
ncbi:ANTAR domain-containing protein [Nocardioides KLBMP 9356]|uniref:ANTAR domain-containing protein n=1 Tax=Nocardioides potassii TaxID=2911371 RepID=A0ABS9HG22_9ACTN|nr:ANTAR domain-containing protein [Nocardioides potassii]MCF6379306.1 ANTAR domain-containing protein [Nocardioides potassii]